MDVTEITTILGTILGVITPLIGTGVWQYRKQNKRLKDAEAKLAEVNVDKAKVESKADEWHLWKEQIEAEREHAKFQDERVSELLRANAEKDDRHQQDIKDWEERFDKSVDRTREIQRENSKLATEKTELIEQLGLLRLELERKRCDTLDCPFRQPPNVHTPPHNGDSKEKYFKSKKGK